MKNKLFKVFFIVILLFTISACNINSDEPKDTTVNITEAPKEEVDATISEVLNGQNTNYKTTGTVKAKSDFCFIIGDEENNIVVYNEGYKGINIGDKVEVTGKTEIFGKIKMFKSSSKVTKIATDTLKETPTSITASILEGYSENPTKLLYVKLNGLAQSQTGETIIYLDDCSTQVKLLNSKDLKEGYYNVTGYLSFVFNTNGTSVISLMDTLIEEDQSKNTDDTKTGEIVDLDIISFNDLHGYIMPNEYGKRGLSNISYQINKIREEKSSDNVMLLANGDMFQGTGLVKCSYGEVMIEAMNQMKFDACCIGNHEFDWDLPTILRFFDGNLENGEANFPLMNANVYDANSNILITDDKIFESKIFDKAGIKVGFIGYIGDVKSSINAIYANNYRFDTNFTASVTKLGTQLKKAGADIIIVSIHDGNSNGVEQYEVNNALAKLKYGTSYLVDAVLNGHTHTHQSGKISRVGGTAMPVVQASPYSSGYANEVGRITLKIDSLNKCVTDSEISYINANYSDTDQEVDEVLNKYYLQSKDILEEVYCYNESYINRYDQSTYDFIANIITNACATDASLVNTGGIRANINAGKITFEDVYQMNPFDNKLIVHKVKYKDLAEFMSSSSYFGNLPQGKSDNDIISVAVIDYVFYSSGYKYLRTESYIDTELILRDLIIEELRLHKSGLNLKNNSKALIKPKSIKTSLNSLNTFNPIITLANFDNNFTNYVI